MSGKSQFALLGTERFWPLFLAQAIGAFNDNALRNGIAILIIFEVLANSAEKANLFVQAGTALFILPYFLFSAISGQLADKYDKSLIARRVKLAEIAVMAFGVATLWLGNPYLNLAVLFLAGALAAFFSPVKYGVLPQYLKRDELIAGNALIEMGTFVTILLGTMFGGFLVLDLQRKIVLSAVVVVLSVAAWGAAMMMPAAPATSPDLKLDWNIIRQTGKILGYARERFDVFWSVLGASWFWFLGTVMLVQLPLFTKDVLMSGDMVANLLIATFTIGIGAGSMLTNALLKGEVSAKYVPIAAIMMTVFMIDLYFASGAVHERLAGSALNGPAQLFSAWSGWRTGIDLFLIAFFGGIYAVPLNAIMQNRAAPPRRARVIAANNVVNAIFIILATAASVVLLKFMTQRGLFMCLAIANAAAAVVICRILPQELIAYLARRLFRLLYQVEVRGLEHLAAAGRRAVIVANHTSLLDGPLLSAFLPEPASFAINTRVADRWWVRPAFQLFDLLTIDPTNPLAVRTLVNELKGGRKVVIFPEGRLTVTGALMKIYEGPGTIAHLAGAPILPVRIEGAQYSIFSRMRGKLRLRWFPKITLTFLPPVKFDAPPGLKGSALRDHLANRLYEVMTDMVFRTSPIDKPLFASLLDARDTHGGNHRVLEDIGRVPLTYDRLIAGSFILGRKIARLAPAQKHVGLLLPNAGGTFIAFFGLHAFRRIPAMLNFSTGGVNMAAACAAAEIGTIVTSRRFIETANLDNDLKLLAERARIIYLEDIRDSVRLADKLYGLVAKTVPHMALRRAGWNPDCNAPAVILFTSGSEGAPKGVVLSHRNLQANRFQAAARIDFTAHDIVLNPLPMFHAFGLTAGTLLPVLSGVRTFLYPSPLHYKIIPELAYDINASVLIGTDTFLMGYARNAHPYDFFTMRYVVAGAERVKPETRELWVEKFGIRILEGYGATECSPVLAVNTPMYYRSGTVGRLLDAIEYRLDAVEGIAEGGRLVVKGPNIMLGYLRADRPGFIDSPPDGWYDTGDIVKIDDQGFVTILGRAKRFAKIGGEMVPLNLVEQKVHAAIPAHAHAVVAVPDRKKGEQLVLVTTDPELDRTRLSDVLKEAGVSELMMPRIIINVPELPALGSGKTDYVTINRLAREKTGE